MNNNNQEIKIDSVYFNKINSLVDINENIFNNLCKYVDFLLLWNKKMNLISKSTENDIWERHIIDSIQLAKYIKNKEAKIADIGTGAGLPGVPLVLLGYRNIEFFEKSSKKCFFLKKCFSFLSLSNKIRNENLYFVKDLTFDIVVSRALANLNLLIYFSKNLIKKNSELFFLKGKKIYQEVEDAKKQYSFTYELFNSITSTDGKIIKLKFIN